MTADATRVSTAAERAVGDIVRARSGITSLPNPVQCPEAPLGDFRLDVRPHNLAGEGLVDGSVITVATVRFPKVYVRVGTRFLYDEVVDAVLGDPLGFGGRTARVGGPPVVTTFCSPNANKALHIGHLRACFLGMAVANLQRACGQEVIRSEMVSDYGIHICEAIASYRRWGEGTTPGKTKADHFVGQFYQRFHAAEVPLEEEAHGLLQAMAANDPEALRLNRLLTGWAIDGIRATYRRIGTEFDLSLSEWEALRFARCAVASAIERGACHRRADGSAYVYANDGGISEVTLLRCDDTPLVYAQLIGVWIQRDRLHPGCRVLHMNGDQWRDGGSALLTALTRVGEDRLSAATERLYYGMVTTPKGKMRSCTGSVINADELLDRLRERWQARLRFGLDDNLADALGVALLKYAILRSKRAAGISFDEDRLWSEEGQRFAQVLKAVVAVAGNGSGQPPTDPDSLDAISEVRPLLLQLDGFPRAVDQALERRDPSLLVRYVDDLSRRVLALWPVLSPSLVAAAGLVLGRSLGLLDIRLPEPGEPVPGLGMSDLVS